jgi:sugar phosphate isomerase/epimerase
MKIGAMVESFRAGLVGGLEAAAEVGADGVQIYATSGEMHPDNMNAAARKELRKRLADLGLELAALCGDFGGHGFQDAAENVKRVEDSKHVMDLALDLGCKVVTTHIGVVPQDASNPRYAVMAKACEAMGRHGQSSGATFAIETGPENAQVLRAFLDHILCGIQSCGTPKSSWGCSGGGAKPGHPQADLGVPQEGVPQEVPGIGVNFDPANLVMVQCEDIPKAVGLLGKYIVHTHAKDGQNLCKITGEQLYNGADVPPNFKPWECIKEVPLGEGQVPWPQYIAALKAAKFDGYLTIEREVGEDPRHDIAKAIGFLKSLL